MSCSKDSTVSLSSVGDGRLKVVRTYDEFANGVLKCVRWQTTATVNKMFAACGTFRILPACPLLLIRLWGEGGVS